MTMITSFVPAHHEGTSSLPAGFSAELADTIGSIGSDDFYSNMIRLGRRLLPCDFWVMAQYSRRGRPRILCDDGMSHAAKSIYAQELWALDPVNTVWAAEKPHPAFNIEAIRDTGGLDLLYARYLERTAHIRDELTILLPVFDDVCLALGFDRRDRPFSGTDVALGCELQNILQALHRQHLERHFERLGDAQGSRREVMIRDNDNHVLYRSAGWAEAIAGQRDLAGHVDGMAAFGDDIAGKNGWRLRRTTMNWADSWSSGMQVFILDGDAEERLPNIIRRFARRHGLTRREGEIVELSLAGHHNASIARKLEISLGVVKNHKHRLYNKLDITSERELAALIFQAC
ncbi:helix-turn-helix transcriptional regulator [Taklimakanibacter lacteus]|uniref:helix-turn-helix transcriptional regulator n=1 Tax=Taklimakanibacter lacteus TaxID=2268456 RepID=UPI0034D68A49